MSLSFKIKICGITCIEDANAALEAGADAIGLNFYPGSKRCVTAEQAAIIATAIPVTKVGVFVNPSREEVANALRQVRLDAIQFHGDEPAEFVAQFSSIPVLRAFRWQDGGQPIDEYLAKGVELKFAPSYMLVDSHVAGSYGGSGIAPDWKSIAVWRHQGHDRAAPRLALAGGLTPANVADAIRITRPDAVDTASGVESSPGRKDARLMREFVAAARRAFTEIRSL